MGASHSTDHRPSPEQQEQESLATSTGSLTCLKSAFAKLSVPQSQSIPLALLQLSLSVPSVTLDRASSISAPDFPLLLPHVGTASSELLFAAGKDGTDWTAFLQGYNRCCARMSATSSFNLLCRLFYGVCRRAGIASPLDFDQKDAEDGKVEGRLEARELLMLLWLCWVMDQSPRIAKRGGGALFLPDLSHMLLSAFATCDEVVDDEGLWDFDCLQSGKSVSLQKLSVWLLTTAPGLLNCFPHFLREKIRAITVSGENSNNDSILSASGGSSTTNFNNNFLLTFGAAWAISLTQRNSIGEEFSDTSFSGLFGLTMLDNLLYRSSAHGKGLSRFWSRLEGYHGPLLFLFSGNSSSSSDVKCHARRWVVGVLIEHGFQNRDNFYGNSAHLYAIYPIFHVLPPTGKEKNFIYSHLRHAGRFYEASPKPVGLAFGGTIGNERIFIDEDFSRVIIRHHAVDKTYQHGSLVPNQGYLPIEASLVEAEVWGFGGRSAKEQQNAFKRREELFTEQRRKVDLKTFGSWEDSPEKMMMDMISDPNKVQREDR